MSDANIATLPDAGRQGSPMLGGNGSPIDAMRLRMTGLLRQPAIQRSLPMMGLIGVTALSGLAWLALREPPQRDLFRGLPDGDKAAVAAVLDKNNIPYSFDGKDGSISVAEDAYFNAKMKLAAEGLPKSAPDGSSLIDTMPMGASRAVEGEKLRTAREMDLARTIEQIGAVDKARVHLAVEPPSIFLREQTKPSASVMLQLAGGRSLSQEQVEAIVHLVASSVPNMTPDAVSVVDQSGRLLSQTSGENAEADRQIAVQSRIEERYRQAVTALLTPILGTGKFSTEVHAEVNFAERQATRETYPAEEARLRSENGSWNTDANGNGTQVGGIPGAIQPTPPPTPTQPGTPPPPMNAAPGTANANGSTTATPAAPGMPPFKTAETFNRSYELGHEVSVTRDAVGTVKRLSVAVALDNGPDGKPRSAQEVAALEQLVKGAVGFDQTRGDVVALSSRKFATVDDPANAVPWYEASWVPMVARNVSALLVTLILLLGIGRPLLKRWTAAKVETERQETERRTEIGNEINAELTQSATRDPAQPVTLDMISATHDYTDRAALIRNFVKQDPDRAALVVRDLLREGAKDNG
jgi:flagellar M-ring protein FliF